jgi:hypothetical protein
VPISQQRQQPMVSQLMCMVRPVEKILSLNTGKRSARLQPDAVLYASANQFVVATSTFISFAREPT